MRSMTQDRQGSGMVGQWEVLLGIPGYSKKRIKELQDSADEQDRRIAPLFDPNNQKPFDKLPVILQQWEKDPEAPSGWSYRVHNGLTNPDGMVKLAVTWVAPVPKAKDWEGFQAYPANVACEVLYLHQSDGWRFNHPRDCVTTELLGTMCGYAPLADGELVWMPGRSVRLAQEAGLQADWERRVAIGKVKEPSAGSNAWLYVPAGLIVGCAGAAAAAQYGFKANRTTVIASAVGGLIAGAIVGSLLSR